MGQLAMREIDRAPLLEDGEDLGLLPRQEPMDRVAARGGIVEAARGLAVPPPPRPLPVQLEDPADPGECPPGLYRTGSKTRPIRPKSTWSSSPGSPSLTLTVGPRPRRRPRTSAT